MTKGGTGGPRWPGRTPGCSKISLKQPLCPSQVSESTNVGQREGKAELIFVAYRSQSEAAVFDVHSAAVPVVGQLPRTVLDLVQVCIKTQIYRAAESPFVGAAITEDSAELIKNLWSRVGTGR